jgi:hypothetical protein
METLYQASTAFALGQDNDGTPNRSEGDEIFISLFDNQSPWLLFWRVNALLNIIWLLSKVKVLDNLHTNCRPSKLFNHIGVTRVFNIIIITVLYIQLYTPFYSY